MNDLPTFRHEQRLNHLFLTGIILLMLLLSTVLVLVIRYQPGSDRPWRIAITNWPGFDYLYLAQQKGFFRENGLNISLVPVNSIIDMRSSFERGTIDGYTSSIMDVAESVHESAVPARIVLVTDYSNGGDQLLADSSIATVAELKGKRLGLEATSTLSSYLLQHALEGSSTAPTDINIVSAAQTILVDQARRGNLDAIITYEPYSSQVQSGRAMHILYDSSRIPQEISDVVAVSPAMLKAVPELSKKLQKAWQSALDYATAHPDEAHAIFAQRYNLTVSQYASLANDVTILDSGAMQRLANSDVLARSIMRTSTLRHGDRPLPAAEISSTLAVWFQQESR